MWARIAAIRAPSRSERTRREGAGRRGPAVVRRTAIRPRASCGRPPHEWSHRRSSIRRSTPATTALHESRTRCCRDGNRCAPVATSRRPSPPYRHHRRIREHAPAADWRRSTSRPSNRRLGTRRRVPDRRRAESAGKAHPVRRMSRRPSVRSLAAAGLRPIGYRRRARSKGRGARALRRKARVTRSRIGDCLARRAEQRSPIGGSRS